MSWETSASFINSPQKRSNVSPVILVIIGGLLIYFIWLDLGIYISLHYCINFTLPDSLSVKVIMQPPTVHYLEQPISEWLEKQLSLSLYFSPNFISGVGVFFGLLSAWLIIQSTRTSALLGVFSFKIRDLMDALDGVIARGLGTRVVPTPGTTGYYVDGWCDVASDVALILAVGHL